LLGVLNSDGEEARIVGGAVRNALLGEPVHEIDVATTALPQLVVQRVESAGFKAVPTGIEHGTVTVVIDRHPFEVTTLREDVETYGRHAKVVFGRDWQRDAERRDFTMNALSASADGTIHDYVGGIADADARHVRFFRFHAAYGRGELDAAGFAACIAGREGLDQLSRERVRMELLKLLVAPRAVASLAAMLDAGLLVRVLDGVPNVANVESLAAIEQALALGADATRRLAALGVLVPED